MPNYRRAFIPGGTFFLTLVTHERKALFAEVTNVDLLRDTLRSVKDERPFEILAAAVLPDHIHFLWELPSGDGDFSRRVGRLKAIFTRSLRERGAASDVRSFSRLRRHEAEVWQRRFWEHVIRDERDLERHLDYIHYNPVKHGLASCPHVWPYSSFAQWVANGTYTEDWSCGCGGRVTKPPSFEDYAYGE